MYMASPVRSSRIFARHLRVFALRRARPRAGRRIEISSAMIPITTSNSTSVNACRLKCRTSCLAERDAREHTPCVSDAFGEPRQRVVAVLFVFEAHKVRVLDLEQGGKHSANIEHAAADFDRFGVLVEAFEIFEMDIIK